MSAFAYELDNWTVLDEEDQRAMAEKLQTYGWQVRAPRDQHVTPLQHAGHDTDHATVAKMRIGTFREELFWHFQNVIQGRVKRPDIVGWTDDELEILTGRSGSTVRSARNDLLNRGLVYDSGQRRITRGGNQAIVWVRTRREMMGVLK